MLINGVEYRIRVTPLAHFLNGEPSPIFVDTLTKEILVSSHGVDTLTLAMMVAEATTTAYEAEAIAAKASSPVTSASAVLPLSVAPPSECRPSPEHASPGEEPIQAVIGGCFGVTLLYPRSLDPQWKHLAQR